MDEAAIRPPAHILGRGNDGATARTDLSGGTQFIVLWVQTGELPAFALLILDLSLQFVRAGW